MIPVILAALVIAGPPDRETAVELPEVSPLVSSITRGGFWKAGEQDGTYRVILACAGWEHVGCSVAIEWVRPDPDAMADVIVRRVAITGPPDGWSMAVEELRYDSSSNKTRLRIGGTDAHSGKTGTFVYVLGPPGEWRLAKKSE